MEIVWQQIVALFILAIPIACVARTVVFEEVFREPREFCADRSKACGSLWARKFFYLFTCEYCFSHYVTAAALVITRYHLLFADWRGYVIAFFSLVFVANIYMNAYNRMRVEITVEKKTAEAKTKQIEKLETEICEKLGVESRDGEGIENAEGREQKAEKETVRRVGRK